MTSTYSLKGETCKKQKGLNPSINLPKNLDVQFYVVYGTTRGNDPYWGCSVPKVKNPDNKKKKEP